MNLKQPAFWAYFLAFLTCGLFAATEAEAQNENRKQRKKNAAKSAAPTTPKPLPAPTAPKTVQPTDPAAAKAGVGMIKGVVMDSSHTEGLIEAAVYISDIKLGIYTDYEGAFTLPNVPAGEHTLQISYIGYQTQTYKVKSVAGQTLDLGQIKMRSNEIGLEEVEIVASYAVGRKTPVVHSNVDAMMMADKNGALKLPDVLRLTPSVYTSRLGGGLGDSRMSVRGFDQSNVAVLMNGIPFNDMSSGWLYWSNFIGVNDIAQNIQVQRGLGASRLAINSIGGSINIITKNAEAERGGSVVFEHSNVFAYRTSLNFSTGRSKSGWAGTFSATRIGGAGYVEHTNIDAWFYFAAVSKNIGKNHLITFNAFGAPQSHYQRETYLSKQEADKFGAFHNTDWGMDKGESRNLYRNYYHKPQFTLSHHWQINEKMHLSTSIYVSPGWGGGVRPGGKSFPRVDSTGYLDWDAVRALNQDKLDTLKNAEGQQVVGYNANLYQRTSVNNQLVAGLLSTLSAKINDYFNLTGGVDIRYSKTHTYRFIDNLLGADFLLDKSNVNNPLHFAKEGDMINYDRDEIINWQGLFGQAEYSRGALSAFASVSLSMTQNQRVDRFVYDLSKESDRTPVVNVFGYNAKIGANYNLNEHHNVFLNTGVYSRAPYISFLFVGDRNDLAKNASNETVWGLEGGYGFTNSFLIVRADGYLTLWKDKQLLGRRTYLPDGSLIQPRLNGLGAIHYGFELEVAARPIKRLKLSASFSIGSWKWKNDVIGTTFNDVTGKTDTLFVVADGLNVGNAPQTSLVLGATYEPIKNLRIGADFFLYDRFYANFDVTTRNNPEDRTQPYKLPAYALLDMNASYTFKVWKLKPTIRANVHNLFNARYISDANDGKNHDEATSTFYYGFGRTYSVALEVKF